MTVTLIVASLLLAVTASAQSYDVSEEKQKLITRLNKIACRLASENNFHDIKKLFKRVGLRYFGEEIRVEEAYPYIRCDMPTAPNIDLFRVAVERLQLDLFFTSFIFHFAEVIDDKTFLSKIVGCKRDFGHECLDVFEHIEKNRRVDSNNETLVKKYDLLESALWRRMDYGFIRDPRFCRELLDEPPKEPLINCLGSTPREV